MQPRLSYAHVLHLISELRHAAEEAQMTAGQDDDGGLKLGLDAALVNETADALEALLAERPANVQHDLGRNARDDRHR